ncbi:MAG: hypothetical protein PW786_12505 [Arachidicoccus sp.]|nr:hypothetical protein [Arachidicoccus sp.]
MNNNTHTEKIIVLRFSSMGDVAIVASFLKEFREKYPSVKTIMVSKPPFQAFFQDISDVTFHPLKAGKEHKGIFGLFKLYKELKQYKPSAIADLHDSLRSHIICSFFRLSGIKIQRLDKGRKEKKELTRPVNKILRQAQTYY